MAFGFKESTGDFLPIVKFDSKDGRLSRVDRTQGPQGWEKHETDITDRFSAVMDMDNLKAGWIYFSPTGPQKAMSIYEKEPRPDQPLDKTADGSLAFRPGFTVIMALAKDCGGGIFEMSGTAKGLMSAMEAVYLAYKAAPERQAGKLPIVALSTSIKEETKFGKFYRPVFEIKGWSDRPEGLTIPTEPKTPAPAFAKNPPSTGSTPKLPPAASIPAPAPQQQSAGDFG
jgi:hypothetical protein